jgi:alpha-L-fucosidase
MDWRYAARFGTFIHFGSYSFLAYGERAFSIETWSKADYQSQVSAGVNPAASTRPRSSASPRARG